MTPPIDRASIERLAHEVEIDGYDGDQIAETLRALRDALDAARAQLPEGMKHCTILFKECEKGHGWLTATNWVPCDCPTCALDAARENALEESAALVDQCNSEGPYNAIDAARRIRALKTKE